MKEAPAGLSRREALGGVAILLVAARPAEGAAAPSATRFGAWLSVLSDGRLQVMMPGLEMGQGSYTGIAKVLVDELGGDFDTAEIVLSPADKALVNPITKEQMTSRSLSMRGYYPLMRKVGAQAREMLKAAAARRAGLAPDAFVVEGRQVRAKAGRPAWTIRELAAEAAALPPPADPPLKSRAELRLVGKRTPGKDWADKAAGRAVYTSDLHLPGMLTATVKHCPAFGGKPLSWNTEAVLALPGVRAIVPVGGEPFDLAMPYDAGLAVAADSFWQAKTAADALEVKWSPGRAPTTSSADLKAARPALTDKPSIVAVERGDLAAADRAAASRLDVTYDAPFLAHAPMEPMSCVAEVAADRATLWVGTQHPLGTQKVIADLLGLPVERVTVNRTFAGGGFGRRWQRDFAIQAVQVARAVKRPVKLLWTREEDTQHDFYRPAMTLRARASFDAASKLTGLRITSVGPSLSNWQRNPTGPPRADINAVSGIENTAYAFGAYKVEYVEQKGPFPIGVWRSVSESQNVFFMETLLDELAEAAGADPYRYRRDLLAKSPRQQRVLDAAAKAIGWGGKLPSGEGLGIATKDSHDSFVACAAHVASDKGRLEVRRIVVVIDCGVAVDPYNIEAQLQGGVVFALSTLRTQITMKDGAVEQSSYVDYPILTLAETPPVQVIVLETEGAEPGGVAETGVPCTLPAVLNAWRVASGRRVRSLPLEEAKAA